MRRGAVTASLAARAKRIGESCIFSSVLPDPRPDRDPPQGGGIGEPEKGRFRDDGHCGPRRHSWRRLERGRVFLVEGSPGTGKTTIAMQFLIAGAAAGERTSTSPSPRPRTSCAPPPRTAGRSTGSKFSSWYRPKACSTRASSRACFIRPTSSSARPPGGSSRRSSACGLTAWSSTACPRSACSRKARSAIAARSSRSSIFARQNTTVLMLDDLTTEMNDRTVHSVAHGVVGLEDVVRDYGAPRRRLRVVSIAAAASAAATISPSRPAASRSFRGWSPPSTGRISSGPCWPATAPSSTPCSAASSAARASSSSARRAPASRCWRSPSSSAPSSAASAARCSCSTRSSACSSIGRRGSASTCRRWSRPASS